MNYQIVIGLEVHVELKTQSKLCCGCSTEFEAKPNTLTCPICLGLPGTLPVLNKKAVELSILTGLALNCQIANYCQFDRKQYFYPDLPKGYQITQFYHPICYQGWLEIDNRKIGITRIHLEEEASRSYHSGKGIFDVGYTLVDDNRSNIPLIEIVTAPELHSPQEARRFMEELKTTLEYIEVSDCKMAEGSLRCDANISVCRRGDTKLGKRVEIKNMNSFRALETALEYETKRQISCLEQKTPLEREESRGWVEEQGKTVFMRFKEKPQEYRYFPDPDLPPLIIEDSWIQDLSSRLPELPGVKRQRYLKDYGLPKYDTDLIISSKQGAKFFEEVMQEYRGEAKMVSNWFLGELARLINLEKITFDQVKFKSRDFACLLFLLDQKKINSKIAKLVFEEMFYTGKNPEVIVEEKGLIQINDVDVIQGLVRQAVAANPKSVRDYLSGKKKAFGFLVGQIMKETKGKANPKLVTTFLQKELNKDNK